MQKNTNLIYLFGHNLFFDRIIKKKRFEILKVIKNKLENDEIYDALDIGTTEDDGNESSNIIIKNLKNVKIFKSISNQNISSSFFSNSLTKSISSEFNEDEVKIFKSDLVISSAVIEHVGSSENRLKMIKNIIKLTKKTFIITTPNRNYPIDFHTKIPFIHWLPKNIHRQILKLIGLKFFSKEENLNLLNKNNLKNFLNDKNIDYEIVEIKFLGLTSNFIVIGKVIT